MAYTITTPQLGFTRIGAIDTTQRHPLGTIVHAADPSLGEAEFIYLKGIANTQIGACVTYNQASGVTTLAPDTAGLAQPVAFASAAILANQFGWYQIGGAVAAKKTAVVVNADVAMFLSATPGAIMPTAAAGKQILGCRSANTGVQAAPDPTVLVLINRPHLQGQIT